MRRISQVVILLLFVLNLSCTAYKSIPYLQDSELLQSAKPSERYAARIVPNDILSIFVNSTDPIAAESFNLMKPTSSTSSASSTQYIDYIVDEQGCIDFPVVGQIEAVDLTCRELEDIIKKRLESYLVEAPVVTVQMTDFKVSVLGEVTSPGVQVISSGKVNIFEALAMAGDLTIYGKREGVKLVRECEDGSRKVIKLNLNDSNIVNSEYYYLVQNDVIYVAPNKPKGNTSAISSSTTIWISFVSTFMSIASFVVALTL